MDSLAVFLVLVALWGATVVLLIRSERPRKGERVDFEDLSVKQIDRFFEAIVRTRERAVMAVAFSPSNPASDGAVTVPAEVLNGFAEPEDDVADLYEPEGDLEVPPFLFDWKQEIIEASEPARVIPPDPAQVILGAARAWRQGVPGSDDILARYVDQFEESLVPQAPGRHAVRTERPNPSG